jgi:hypothetical protein
MATIQGDGRNAPGLPKTGAANKSAADSAIADATKGMPTTTAQAIAREVYSRLGIGEGTATTPGANNERVAAIALLKSSQYPQLASDEEAIRAAIDSIRKKQSTEKQFSLLNK